MKNTFKYIIFAASTISAVSLAVFFCWHSPTTLFDSVAFSLIALVSITLSLYVVLFTKSPEEQNAENNNEQSQLDRKFGRDEHIPLLACQKCGEWHRIYIDTTEKEIFYKYSKCRRCHPESIRGA
jgi:hypothetical protein